VVNSSSVREVREGGRRGETTKDTNLLFDGFDLFVGNHLSFLCVPLWFFIFVFVGQV
jgi:hypothetical protein